MHREIQIGLEDYLDGRADRSFQNHLAGCAGCREEVSRMQSVSGTLAGLKSSDVIEPSLGFHARVMRQVVEKQGSSFWGALSLDPGFARKLAFGSLLGLATLGAYLFTGVEDPMALVDHTPEAVMASHDSSVDQQQHLNGMLVTLANYHQ